MPIPLLVSFVVGVASALAAILILIPFRTLTPRSSRLNWALSFAVLFVPVVLVLLASTTPADETELIAELPPMPAPRVEGGMKQDADWALISHAFMGGAPPGAAGAAAPQQPALERARLSTADLEEVTRREPRNAEAWLALAGARRTSREFPEAIAAYEAALKLSADNPDSWADYADALATANGRSLIGKPATAIKRTLALDPRHMKGLWLAASLDLEQRDYSAALKRWQELRAALPAGSPDAGIIDANIAEARTLAGQVARAP